MLTDLDYELLSAYIDDALTQTERAAFELRLQTEPELSRELDELRATVTLLNNLPPRKAPRDFTLDARYARRSSFFFTSATFSALSTAAAIILFALGAYLFTGNKASPQTAAVGQSAQSALVPTTTGATLDKSAASTATELDLTNLNEIHFATPVENSPSTGEGFTASGGLAQESTTFVAPPPAESDQPIPFLQPDVTQPTILPDDGIAVGSAPMIAPSSPDTEGRTSEATETIADQQYAAPSSSTTNGNAALPSTLEETQADTSAASVFAATQPPFTATPVPSATQLPAVTLAPSATSTSTATVAPQPTNTAQPTVAPTILPPEPSQPSLQSQQPQQLKDFTSAPSDSLPLFIMGLGIILLIVAIATTIIRRRNRS